MAEETLELSLRDAVEAVKNNGTLTTLMINSRLGSLDDAAGTALGEALKTNRTLTALTITVISATRRGSRRWARR